ncbi:MAG: DSD1 family PLP-dependent enzyme [Bacteroidota bacterium]|nr:DSD1 family PLP-dependent enzyme [Bacteroidota bacterium]
MERLFTNKLDLETPCLILDVDIVEQNLRRMQTFAEAKGKKLRPHAKTHKCTALAKKQIEYGAIGVCAAKVSEAEKLANAGVSGILLTGPFVTAGQIHKIVEIRSTCPSFVVAVDHPAVVQKLSDALRQQNIALDVLLDIDVGLERTGVTPSNALSMAEEILSYKNLRLRGIQAYAGHLQHIASYQERKKASYSCFEKVIPLFTKLKKETEGCTIFSASGTGTFAIDSGIPEITEFQVGSYVCMDAEYLAIESTERDGESQFKPALRLLTTVVSANQKGFVTVDAGLKSLYRDGAVPQIITPAFAGMTYDWFGDEYGKIICGENIQAPSLGTVIELVVSHCDPTINLFDRFYLTRGDEVVDQWNVDLRGCSQ